jgi:hypothetical protein
MPTKSQFPVPSAKNEQGEFARFTNFVDRVLSVPHSKIKERLDAEKQRKQIKRASASGRASRDNG